MTTQSPEYNLRRALGWAIALAARAHKDQTDKQGRPYILHAIRVMLKMGTDEGRIVAVLHDVLEDGVIEERKARTIRKVTVDDLINIGLDHDCIEAVKCLTRHGLARFVKLSDLEDNLDETRGPIPQSLRNKYFQARERLLDAETAGRP